MKKFFGLVIVVVVVAFGMKLFNTPKTNTWLNNVPQICRTNTTWQTKPQTNSNGVTIVKKLQTNNHYGFDPTETDYRNGKKLNQGNASSAFSRINPHYSPLAHHYYKVTAGGIKYPQHINDENSLHYELHDTIGHDFGGTFLMKVYNKHCFSLWQYQGKNKNFVGTFYD